MKIRSLAIVAFALSGTLLFAQSATWKIDPNHSDVTFQVRHLAVSTVRGSIHGVQGTVTFDPKDITKATVTATTEVANINTGVDARDKDLRSPRFFNVEKYPQISFKSTSFNNKDGKLQVTGDLTLGPVTKSITLDLDGPSDPQTDAKGVTRSGFSATGMLSRKDFDFGQGPAGVPISDQVKFTIDIEIDKQ